MRVLVAVAALVAAAGCPPADLPTPPLPPVSAGKVHVRVFTEPAPARAIATAGSDILVATDNGLEQWDAGGHVTADDARIARAFATAVATATTTTKTWLLDDTGVALFDPLANTLVDLPPPPPSLDLASATSLAADDDAVWIGMPTGLERAAPDGWTDTPIAQPIRALARDGAGWLWISTPTGVVARKPSGELLHLTAADGFALSDVRALVDAPDHAILAIGSDDAGHERIAIGREQQWTTYRTLPGVRWDAAVRRGNTIIAMGGDRLYRIAPADGVDRPLARDGMRLVPVATAGSAAAVDWMIDPIDVVLPPGAIALGAADDQLLVGTRDLGTARYRDGDRHPRAWLRRRAMFADATSLAVACTAREDCWLATGARRAWHWTGDRFAAAGPADDSVLAVVRDPDNVVYAIDRSPAEPTALHISRIDAAGTWTQLAVTLATPGDRAELVFARFAGPDKLVVGLGYREDDEPQTYRVAVVEPAAGRVALRDDASTPAGFVTGDVRSGATWLASDDSLVRLVGAHAQTYAVPDTLHAAVRAMSLAPTGDVVVATRAGAGTFDGRSWDFPAALRFEVNGVVATRTGAWMATERGVVAWDGHNLRRFDTFRGLAENEVLDVAADQFDRIWARGPGSLTLIAP